MNDFAFFVVAMLIAFAYAGYYLWKHKDSYEH